MAWLRNGRLAYQITMSGVLISTLVQRRAGCFTDQPFDWTCASHFSRHYRDDCRGASLAV